MCARKEYEEWECSERATRVNGANEARCAKGATRLRSGTARGRGAGDDAQPVKLLEEAERVRNGAADLVVVQVTANVHVEGMRRRKR